MAEPANPRVNYMLRYFVPGLVLGIVIGGVFAAFVAPRFESSVPEFKPKTGTPTPRPATPPTGSTGPTDRQERPLEPVPTGAPTGAPK
jgi:hypothetical protein